MIYSLLTSCFRDNKIAKMIYKRLEEILTLKSICKFYMQGNVLFHCKTSNKALSNSIPVVHTLCCMFFLCSKIQLTQARSISLPYSSSSVHTFVARCDCNVNRVTKLSVRRMDGLMEKHCHIGMHRCSKTVKK